MTDAEQQQPPTNLKVILLVKQGVLLALEEWENAKMKQASEQQNVRNQIQPTFPFEVRKVIV